MKLSHGDKRMLLDFSRSAIRDYFVNKSEFAPDKANMSFSLTEDAGVYVRLLSGSNQRGLAGYYEPAKQVWQGVVEGAINAAFFTPRNRPLAKEEFNQIDIEISVLGIPEKLEYLDANDLLRKIDTSKGVTVKKGMQSATFLPNVWTMAATKEDFLDNLCATAGLKHDAWEKMKLEIYVFNSTTFSENEFK